MTNPRTYGVLFLCTANSARSILAESILNRAGEGRFEAYSAGSKPGGKVHPLALDHLEKLGYPTANLRSKSWDEFAGPDAPPVDFVFTVCDNAANESCPVWPGRPVTAHWGIPDPASADGTIAEQQAAFANAYRLLSDRIGAFLDLSIESLDRLSIKTRVDEIGRAT